MTYSTFAFRFSTMRLLMVVGLSLPAGAVWGQGAPAAEVPSEPAVSTTTQEVSDEPAVDSASYDHTQVLTLFLDSVTPVKKDMEVATAGFREKMKAANVQMNQGNPTRAIDTILGAMEGMLEMRDRVVDPLLTGQEGMVGAMSKVREKLAASVAASAPTTGEGADRFAPEVRDALTRLAEQHQNASTDKVRRLAAQRFRTRLKIEELKLKTAAGGAAKLNQSTRRFLESQDQMLAVLGELSVNAEITFSTLDAHVALFRQYRESFALASTTLEAQKLMGEMFSASGFTGGEGGIQTQLAEFGQSIDDVLVDALDGLNDAAAQGYGPGEAVDLEEQMNQFLPSPSEG